MTDNGSARGGTTLNGGRGETDAAAAHDRSETDAAAAEARTESRGFPCRPGCGACCIAMSISSPIPGMPEGKPSGVPCIHLTEEYRCTLFGDPRRPRVCADIAARPDMCGSSREEALKLIYAMEGETSPG